MDLQKKRRIIDRQLLERVSKIPCLACPQWPEEQLRDYLDALRSGVKADRISDPHHVTSRGAGGGDTADNVMPLCRLHHDEYDAPFKGPAFVINRYPRVRLWLEAAGRKDVLDRCQLAPPEADQTKEEETEMATLKSRPEGIHLDKEIAFPLTVMQTAEKAQQMAELDGEIQKLEYEKKEFDAVQGEKIKERYLRLRAIAKVVRDKKEVRLASVVMRKSFETNTVEFWHAEDGKVWGMVEERAMEASERQLELDGVAKVPPPSKLANGKKPKPPKREEENEIAQEIRSETNRKTKRSSVDGVYS